MTSPYLNLPRRDLRALEHAWMEDAKKYMGYAAHSTHRGTRVEWERKAEEALQKAMAARKAWLAVNRAADA